MLKISLILSVLILIWWFLFLRGLARPKALFLTSVSAISLINFSFFTDEVFSRIALPDILFSTSLLVLLLRLSLRKENFSLPKIPALLLGLMALSIALSLTASAWNSEILFGEGQPLAFAFSAALFFLVTHYTRDETDMQNFLTAWIIAGTLAALVAFIDMGDLFSQCSGTPKYDVTGFYGLSDIFFSSSFTSSILSPFSFRIQGSFRTTGQLAVFALTTSFVVLAYLLHPQQTKRMKFFLGILFTSLLLCAVLAQRSSIIPSLALGFLLTLAYFTRRSKATLLRYLAVFIFIMGTVYTFVKVNPNLYPRIFLKTIERIESITSAGPTSFVNEQAHAALTALKDAPLFGIGQGRFIYSQYQIPIRGFELHSTPFQVLAETGVFGTFAYLLFMGYFYFLAFQNLRLAWNTKWQDFYAVLFLGFISFSLSYLYNRHMRERTFWLFIALIYIGNRILRKETKARRVTSPSSEAEIELTLAREKTS